MKMEISHYITLPCKVTNESDPVNKISNFTTQLVQEFELQDDWEIGLSEISFPKNWVSLPCDQQMDLIYFKPDEKNYFKSVKLEAFKIKKGEYTIGALFEKCHEAIQNKDGSLYTVIDGADYFPWDLTRKITRYPRIENYKGDLVLFPGVLDDKEYFYLRYDKILGNILGVDFNVLTNIAYNQFAQYVKILTTETSLPDIDYSEHNTGWPRIQGIWKKPDVNRNLKYLYVTSDVIKNDRYRNINKNLLRIVDIPENLQFGEQITQIYNNIYYFPLKKNNFGKIQIEIFVDDEGKSGHVPFIFGDAYVILHLRKINKNVRIHLEDPITESDDPKHKPEVETSSFERVKQSGMN